MFKKNVIIILLSLFLLASVSFGDTGPVEPTRHVPHFDQNSYSENRSVCLGLTIYDKRNDNGLDLENRYGLVRKIETEIAFIFENRKFEKAESVDEKLSDINNANFLLFFIPDHCIPGDYPIVEYYLFEGEFPNDLELEMNSSDERILDSIEFHFGVNVNQECVNDEDTLCDAYDLSLWEEEAQEEKSGHGIVCGCDIQGNGTSLPLALFMFAIGIAAWAISRRTRKK